MPRGVYTNYTCTKTHKKFVPQPHQLFVRDYFVKSVFKGLLLYHRLGSGKTCSSIITADILLRKDIKIVYVFSPGSLRQGWIEEYCGVCGSTSQNLTKNYTFITYNYNIEKELPADFNDSLVIIDEIHNFINGVRNQAKNAIAIYAKLMISKCRILALSGTPIFNNVYEWSLLGNLLKPGSVPPIIISGKLNPDNFMMMFTIAKDGHLTANNPEKFKKAVSGIISYFPGLGGGFYPTIIEEPIIKVTMTPEQEKRYWHQYDIEQGFLKPINPKLKQSNPAEYESLKRMMVIAKKRILSRQPSNFVYPKEISSKYITEETDNGFSKILKPKDALTPVGWVERKYFSNKQLKEIYSTKMVALFNNILNNYHSKHMVFTFFKEHSGVNIMKAILDMCGVPSEIFSGDLSDRQRSKLLVIFNSPANRYGDKIKVIFVTDAGAEGITLLETGHVHILESDARENKIQQVIGRAVRFKSHIKMPKNEQTVHIWRYWSMSEKGRTIDELLYRDGEKKMNTINSFIQLLIDASIENEITTN